MLASKQSGKTGCLVRKITVRISRIQDEVRISQGTILLYPYPEPESWTGFKSAERSPRSMSAENKSPPGGRSDPPGWATPELWKGKVKNVVEW